MRTWSRLGPGLAILAVLVAGAPARGASTLNITVTNNDFSLRAPKLVAGDTVTWTWDTGGTVHRIEAYQGATFDSGDKSSGSFSITFPGGTVLYRCTYHSTPGGYGGWSGMAGSLTDPPPAITVTSPFRIAYQTAQLDRTFVAAAVPGVVPVTFAGGATDNYSVKSVTVEVGGPFCCSGRPTTPYPAVCTGCGTPSAEWRADVHLLPGGYTWRVLARDDPGDGLGTTGSAWFGLLVA